jgi:hypothetical protein
MVIMYLGGVVMVNVKIARLFTVLLFLMVFIAFPVASFADSNINIKIYDPDKGYDVNDKGNGNISYSVLSTPTVAFGDNRVLGTLRVKGKEGIVTTNPGQKVKIELPVGTCYMQAPTVNSYRSYITWPESLDGVKNQIRDGGNVPGIKFLEGTPRSLTVEIGNVDNSGGIMVFDFVFDKENYSAVRVSKLIDAVKSYGNDPEGKITRMDFFKLLTDVTVVFPTVPLEISDGQQNPSEIFSDLGQVSEVDIEKIRPLVNSGLIVGYPDKELRPNEYITRVEAVNLIGKIFPPTVKTEKNFADALPEWAKDIYKAIGLGIVKGYPDGTFRPDDYVTKDEVLNMLQRTMECYKVKS